MKGEKPLTESRLLAILKNLRIPTDESIRKVVEDTVHEKLTEFHHNMTMPAINELREEMKSRFEQVDSNFAGVNSHLDKLEAGQRSLKAELGFVKDEIKGLAAELSTKPSRREFNELKTKVDRYHPSN